MRPPHFGQDITNTQNNNSSSGNDDDGSNDNNRTRQDYIISRLTQNGATPVAPIAGKGIIKVVRRCENAKENNNLGEIRNIQIETIERKHDSRNRHREMVKVEIISSPQAPCLSHMNPPGNK